MQRFCLLLGVICFVSLSASFQQTTANHSSTPADRDSVTNAIQLIPVVPSGLASPVFVTNADDGSNRLFILERGGRIKIFKNGGLLPTAFLDMNQPTTLVRSPENGGGTEQGLLGLAFHPNYPATPYFYVYYTSVAIGAIADGTIVIARYQVSANPDIADSASATIFLTVPHPGFTNHNGGMMAFGPNDGYLYIGMGDGGSANDPNDNAQNINQYLGKIHRIDVNTPNGSIPYSSPPTNPFFGPTNGLDEIYAY